LTKKRINSTEKIQTEMKETVELRQARGRDHDKRPETETPKIVLLPSQETTKASGTIMARFGLPDYSIMRVWLGGLIGSHLHNREVCRSFLSRAFSETETTPRFFLASTFAKNSRHKSGAYHNRHLNYGLRPSRSSFTRLCNIHI
jgi:hypothetical protein